LYNKEIEYEAKDGRKKEKMEYDAFGAAWYCKSRNFLFSPEIAFPVIFLLNFPTIVEKEDRAG